MRSSPSCLVVNRRGLGVHLTFEAFGTSKVPSTPTGSVYQEALAAASKVPSGTSKEKHVTRGRNRKVLFLAVISLLQGLVVVVNELFDIVGYFHFP